MDDLADHTGGAAVVNILPYRLKALKRRRQAALAASFARPSAPAAASPDSVQHGQGAMRAGIRHTASGRMTVLHAEVATVRAMLGARAAGRRGLLTDDRLEAIMLGPDRQVFAGFWP